MTEAEWLAAADPRPLLNHLRTTANERKLLLFCVACCRAVLDIDPEMDGAILDGVELYVDGNGGIAEVARAARKYDSGGCPALAIGRYFEFRADGHPVVLHLHAVATTNLASWWGLAGQSDANQVTADELRSRELTALLRDIFGNPFRPVAFDPAWRTSTVLALARQMYEAREFGAMAILADALQDAGCDSEDILAHCRDAGATHVRGCWVVDLVLGKQ